MDLALKVEDNLKWAKVQQRGPTRFTYKGGTGFFPYNSVSTHKGDSGLNIKKGSNFYNGSLSATSSPAHSKAHFRN